MRRPPLWRIAVLCLGCAAVAGSAAQSADKSDEPKSPLAIARYPQPIPADQLIGRQVLQPLESQPVLGRVHALTRAADGATSAVISYGGWLGWGTRLILVPLAGVSLLGEYVVVTGYTPDQLDRFPTYDGHGAPVPAGTTVKIGLTKPAH